MGYATRVFAKHPINGWQRILRGSVYMIVEVGGSKPEFANLTFPVGVAHIETVRHRAIGLLRLEYAKWRFDAEGVLDRDFLVDQERKRLWPANGEEMQESFSLSADDIACIRKLLRLRRPH